MKKILLIEDDPLIAGIYQNNFKAEGFQVFTAIDGEDGIKVMQEEKPDLIMLDLFLPGVSGVQVLEAIRKSARYSDTPVVVLSNAQMG